MALIRSFERRTLERPHRHQPTDCAWTSFLDKDGEPILQLDTFGSDQRKLQGKASQTIQVDRHGAELLLGALREVFHPGDDAAAQRND